MQVKKLKYDDYNQTCLQEMSFRSYSVTILRDIKNAAFYILCLFPMIDLRMFSLSFLSYCKMDHDLPLFRFAHAVDSDVISM